MKNLLILFATVGIYKKGDIVAPSEVASDLKSKEYLVGIGAVEETDKERAVFSEGQSALTSVLDKKNEEIAELQTSLGLVQGEYDDLKKEHEAYKLANPVKATPAPTTPPAPATPAK